MNCGSANVVPDWNEIVTDRSSPSKKGSRKDMQTTHRLLSATVLTAALAAAQGQLTFPPQVYSSGAVGITTGQTAKWNVVYPPSQTSGSAPACSATLSFADEHGAVLRTESISIKPGESRSLELKDSDIPSTGNRVVVHALAVAPVTASGDQPSQSSTCALASTLEIFDNATGKTSVLAAGILVRPQAGGIIFPFPSLPEARRQ
jgi:hypothetical protein